MSLIPANNPLVKYGAIATIALVVIFNLGYWVVWPAISQPQQDPSAFVPMPAADGSFPTVESTPIPVQLVDQGQILIALVVLFGVVAIGVASWFGYAFLLKGQGLKKDELRKRDLQTLAEGIEAYKRAAGHYPVSSREQQRLLPAVGLGYEWEDLGFPSANEMHKFMAEWPLVDPSVSFDQHDQKNQYLYYPISNGKNFALYAHLEAVPSVGPDYNQIDGLPRAWGQYNYRVGTPMQVAVPPQAAAPAPHYDETQPSHLETDSGLAVPEEGHEITDTEPGATEPEFEKQLSPEEILKLGSK